MADLAVLTFDAAWIDCHYDYAVDDAFMKITHVVRAEEHLSNTLPQILVFEALGSPLVLVSPLDRADTCEFNVVGGHVCLCRF